MIIQFVVGTSRTINLGNYESVRVEASVTVSVDEGADLTEIKKAAQVELRSLMEETYRAQKARREAKDGY